MRSVPTVLWTYRAGDRWVMYPGSCYRDSAGTRRDLKYDDGSMEAKRTRREAAYAVLSSAAQGEWFLDRIDVFRIAVRKSPAA